MAKQLGVDEDGITRKTYFVQDMNADSLDTLELVTVLEGRFSCCTQPPKRRYYRDSLLSRMRGVS